MNEPLITPLPEEFNGIRGNYDTSHPIIAGVLKAKAERLKILQELNKQYQEDFDPKDLLLEKTLKKEKKNTITKKSRASEPNVFLPVRRSTRLQNSQSVSYSEKELCKSEPVKYQVIRPPNDYGPIPGVEIGTHWETRMECSWIGVHRPTVAGIHGGPNGAYSIALSGGYPEDVDEGDFFIYTGAGGRDLKGTSTKPKNLRMAPQTSDQQLEGTNLSLVKSIRSKLPVRVIRGYKSPSVFAPETGYRYDGLYQVVDYWEDIGKTGYKIYRFKMVRLKDQFPPPWEKGNKPIQRKSDEKLTHDFCGNESDFKENIPPEHYNDSILPSRNFTFKEVKEVDSEIQMCIDFFCKVAAISDLEKDYKEEEFHGWD